MKKTISASEYQASQPHFSVVANYHPGPKPGPEPVTNKLEMKKIIRTFLCDITTCEFGANVRAEKITFLRPKINKFGAQLASIGFIFKAFKLSDLRKVLGRGEDADSEILQVLDEWARLRKIKIFAAGIPRGIHYNDIFFQSELGAGVREIVPPGTMAEISQVSWYFDRPLDQKNYDFGDPIKIPSQKVSEIRARRDSHFKGEFGWHDLGLESSLHKLEVLEDMRLKAAILRIADSMSLPEKSIPKDKT